MRIATHVGRALARAHAQGIVHRDLKSGNIFVAKSDDDEQGWVAKVLDFGVAKLTETSASVPALTTDGAPVGTPLYMAPEQAAGGPCDARTDVYALGCILYELLTGQPPFTGPGIARVLVDHACKVPRAPSRREASVPAWLDAVVTARRLRASAA